MAYPDTQKKRLGATLNYWHYGEHIMGGIGIWQLLIILVIVILLFGTKRLKGMGSDLGDAIKGFRKAIDSNDDKPTESIERSEASGETIDATAQRSEEHSTKK